MKLRADAACVYLNERTTIRPEGLSLFDPSSICTTALPSERTITQDIKRSVAWVGPDLRVSAFKYTGEAGKDIQVQVQHDYIGTLQPPRQQYL
jgi:hypothetical protein